MVDEGLCWPCIIQRRSVLSYVSLTAQRMETSGSMHLLRNASPGVPSSVPPSRLPTHQHHLTLPNPTIDCQVSLNQGFFSSLLPHNPLAHPRAFFLSFLSSSIDLELERAASTNTLAISFLESSPRLY